MTAYDLGDTYMRRYEATLRKPAHVTDVAQAITHMERLREGAATAGLSPSDVRVTGTDEHVMVYFTVESTDPTRICPRKHYQARLTPRVVRGHPDPFVLDDADLDDANLGDA